MTPVSAGSRTCHATGLRLVPATRQLAYRVAKDRGRPALEGYPNEVVGPLPTVGRDLRGRWDTIGSTVYFADSPECAFAEVLSYLRFNRVALTKAARRAGYDDVDEYAAQIGREAAENEVDQPWAISCRWQNARSLYHVWLPGSDWWVQIDHPDTLDVLRHTLVDLGADQLVDDLWADDLLNTNRAVTTLLAEHIRNLMLDDGSEPLGINYPSRTLHGRCYAWWNRRGDLGLGPSGDDPYQHHSTNVDVPAMRTIAAAYDLPILEGKPLY